jgi:hypothetical protein
MNRLARTLLVLLLACVPVPVRAASTRLDQGDVVARIVVEQGDVYLQTKSGRPIVVPGHLSLREGDVLTTPAKVQGRFELVRGGTVALAPLKRYRIGSRGLEEPDGKGWQPLGRSDAGQVIPQGETTGGLIAKVRLIGGQAFHRPRGWPQEVPAKGALSMAAGDELRLADGGFAQVQMVEGGWLFLAGPALAAFGQDSIQMESGSALAKALGGATISLGPYRIHGGARVFSLATSPGALTVNALTGVLTVEVEGGKPVYLAPGRGAQLSVGRAAIVRPIAIRPEVQRWEAMFNPSGPRVAIAPEPPPPSEKTKARMQEPPGLKKKNPDGEGPERRSGPPDPRVEEPKPVAVLPLRDRIHAMESRRSRAFYVKKRQEREAEVNAQTFKDQVGKTKDPDEVSAFRLFKLHRAQIAARQELDDFRHDRQMSFQERPYREQPEKDFREREERERLFGEPLFLETRRLLLFASANRQNLIGGANALTRDILIARTVGASDATIAGLETKRQDLLTLADRQTDGMRELIRISMEPYR